MLVHWIWFATRPNLPDRLKAEALELFRDPEALYYAQAESYRRIEGISEDGQKALLDKNLTAAEEILEQCREDSKPLRTFGRTKA